MKDLVRLIHQHGGTVEFRAAPGGFGLCTEHPELPAPEAAAEVTATDCPEVRPCTACLGRVIEQALTAAVEAGDRDPRVVVTVARRPVITAVAA